MIFLDSRYCKHNHILVFRKHNFVNTFRYVKTILEHICKLVCPVFMLRMAVCAYVCNFCIFQISLRMTVMSPLSDEPRIIRDIYSIHILTGRESCLSISGRRCSKQINFIIFTVGRQFYRITATSKTIVRIHFSECETHTVNRKSILWKKFCSITVATLKITRSTEIIMRETILIVRQFQTAHILPASNRL